MSLGFHAGATASAARRTVVDLMTRCPFTAAYLAERGIRLLHAASGDRQAAIA
jgi:hypothetical protein